MTRQEAIDIIKVAQAEVEWEYPLDYMVAFRKAVEALSEPEIIRCKDCKYWDADEHDCNIKTGWFACGADWYCADAERKTVWEL